MTFFSEHLILNGTLLVNPIIHQDTGETIHESDRKADEGYLQNHLIKALVSDITQAYGHQIADIRTAAETAKPDDRWGEDATQRLECPISQTIMEDPVVAADGHTYERTLIEFWLFEHNTSPVTNSPMGNALVPNKIVAACIDEMNERLAANAMPPVKVGLGGQTPSDIIAAFKQRVRDRLAGIVADLDTGLLLAEGGSILTAEGHTLQGTSLVVAGSTTVVAAGAKSTVCVPAAVAVDACGTTGELAAHSVFSSSAGAADDDKTLAP